MDYSLTGGEALSVVLSAAGMYASLLLALRLAGRRLAAGLTASDLAAGISLGALFGRTVLGYTPTLPAGAIGLATLVVLHVGSRRLGRRPAVSALLGGGPVLLVRDGQVVPDALRRARLDEDDLRAALRRASLGCWSEVGAMVLERTGTISVLRRNIPLDDALADVNDPTRTRR